MKIKTRLQIAVILTLIISVTVGLFIFSAYREMNEWSRKEITTGRVSKNMAELKIVTHEYLLHPGERSLMQWRASRDSLAKLLADDVNIFKDLGEKDALKKMLESLERFSDIFAELAAIPGEERKVDEHRKNTISELKDRLTGDLLVESQAMVSRAFLVQQAIQTEMVAVQRKTGLLTVILLIVLAALVSAISLWISRSIGAPITRLEEGIRIIGGGDLDHKVGTDAKDEIGQLSRAFDGMMEDLKKSIASIDDLNREIDARKKMEAALRESEVRFRELFENMRSGVAVYEAVDDGDDFIFKDFNRGAEKIDGVSREAVIGKRVTEVFPGVKEFGVFKVFQRVWQTGKPEHFPDAMYSDERITGWRENYVYKLPSGEVVAIYDDITDRKQAEQKLIESTQNLDKANKRLSYLSYVDELTEINNRRYFHESLDREWKLATRNSLPLSLIMMDIDFFKSYNDIYGHLKGDECLREIAGAVSQALKRPVDFVARYGGEEFVAVLPDTDIEGATHVADLLRKIVEAMTIEHSGAVTGKTVTISLGVACTIPKQHDSSDRLLNEADKALYRAKQEGRNRVVSAEIE